MKSKEWLFEAEQNVAKKKIDQQLDQLSDQEIDALLSMIDKSLDEGRFDYDPLADVPREPRLPKPQKQPQAPRPQPQQQKKQPQPQQKKSEVKAYVDDLANKQKETLKAVLQKEKEEREKTGEKVNKPAKSPSELKKWLQVLLVSAAIGIGGAAFLGTGSSDKDNKQTAQTSQAESGNKKIIGMMNKAPYTVKRQIKRTAYDEDSLKFRNWQSHLSPDGQGGGWILVTGEVNGKNKLGGYVGYRAFIASIDPNSGQVQKLYMDNDPKYILAMKLLQHKETVTIPIPYGPS